MSCSLNFDKTVTMTFPDGSEGSACKDLLPKCSSVTRKVVEEAGSESPLAFDGYERSTWAVDAESRGRVDITGPSETRQCCIRRIEAELSP